MAKSIFKKEKISIETIGKQRFWFGTISGFTAAIAISLIFNKTRELIQYFTSISEDLLIFSREELTFYNYFFVALATVLGLSVTIWIWMEGPIHKKKKHKLYKQIARTNASLFFWLVLFLTGQLGCVFLFLILAKNSRNYGYPLNLYEDFKILFILIPIVIFAQNWFAVRRLYQTGKWITASIGILSITICILHKTTTVDQNQLNRHYFRSHQKFYEYAATTLSESEKKYNITFSTEDKEAIKKRKTATSLGQIQHTKRAFSDDKKIALNTIILQKIIIHNRKARVKYRYDFESRTLANWRYPLPKDILKQIKYCKSVSYEAKELFAVLREEILLVNSSKIIFDEHKIANSKANIKDKNQLYVNIMLIEQLIEVTKTLQKEEKYKELTKILPKIKTTNESEGPNK